MKLDCNLFQDRLELFISERQILLFQIETTTENEIGIGDGEFAHLFAVRSHVVGLMVSINA